MTELVSGPLQLCLQALNANHCLQQVLVEIGILLLQCPEHRGRIRNRGPAYVNNEGYFDFQNLGFKVQNLQSELFGMCQLCFLNEMSKILTLLR